MNLKQLISACSFCSLFVLIGCQTGTESNKALVTMNQKKDIQTPTAKKIAKEITTHGDTRVDDYFWMRLSDEQKNTKAEEQDDQTKDVMAYLNTENSYKEEMLSHTKDFQNNLFDEIVGRIKQTDMSVPYKDNGYFYLTRYEEGKEYPIHSRKKENLEAEEEILLDVNVMAKDYDYYAVGGRSVSPDNKIIAFGEDTLSRRIYTIKFKNLETGELYEDAIPGTTSSVAWANDNKTVFYTKKDAQTLRSAKIFRHVLGTDASKDVEVFNESDDTYSTFVYRSKSGEYIFIGSHSTLANEYQYLKTDEPAGQFKTIQKRPAKGVKLEYSVDHYGDKFYILTNHEAENFRLVAAPVTSPSMENWEDILAHRPAVLLEDIEVFKDFLVTNERVNGITEMRIIPWEGEGEHYIEFEEDAHATNLSVNRDFNTETLRFSYNSMTTPSSVFDYNMKTKVMDLKKQSEVVSKTFKPENYESKRLFATAKDGTKIPISIVYKKGTKMNGDNPLMLYAYGSYGYSMDPYFSSPRLSLLDRGVVYAIAHIRGGSDMGRQWYEDGKMFKKMNTFTDFVDCADYLVAENYTNSDKLFAMGGSAGGLLMGAVINLRPKLFKGIIAAVPFVDVINTMLDESIPLTTGEFNEWGNPKIKEQYDYIKTYSPYDNVEAKEYPTLLVTTGLHDSQVQYWEPAKWVAKLREYNKSDNTILLHTNMSTGHGGASGRFERYKETAMEYAFLFDLIGINEGEMKN